ncbi:fungal specific transcription factor domain-containing protein [Purpureocillium lavendulum]|uniref:Fungal specific transcription factor domain-containing protein n=1 Tax=Purpureocillium lavendulum TaxID=1247861 RepID=A0AB34FR52_9HYPO|nr:fungal specific transcription factor domain-containing protein [Purpureocillium lavendulum]
MMRVAVRRHLPEDETDEEWQKQPDEQRSQQRQLLGRRSLGRDTTQVQVGNLAARRAIAPRFVDEYRTALSRNRDPGPVQIIGGARQDAYQGFARSLSSDEQYLFDFYLDYVISYGYGACHHKEDAVLFQAAMRDIWVPFAMSQPSLMAAIFHVACRNYASITNNTNTTKFALKKLQYRQTCLGMAMEAIRTQTLATDTTIALALLMASESHFEGDIDAFRAHGSGIVKMVAARGGLETLGLGGF